MSSILLLHRGALGDFLMAWPSLLLIREHYADRAVFWAGSASRLLWLRPLGVEPGPPRMLRGVDALFSQELRPMELDDVTLFWFVLDIPPPIPMHPGVHVLHGLPCPPDGVLMPPRQRYARSLRKLGIKGTTQWLAAWRKHCGAAPNRKVREGGEVLLLPGAGHSAKQWPSVQFLELARWLQGQGHRVRFVLGPVERDQGMGFPGYPVSCPDLLEDLQELLLDARLVVGNDSGPLHLAGLLGVPGLALFGPASEAQWAPTGLRIIALDLPCRPCTQTGQISCTDPRCLREIPQDLVRSEVDGLLMN